MKVERKVCTKEHPYNKKESRFWAHPSARVIRTSEDFSYGLEYDTYRCPICGTEFTVEVPQ